MGTWLASWHLTRKSRSLGKVGKLNLERTSGPFFAHLVPAMCHKITNKQMLLENHIEGVLFVHPDRSNVMCHSGNMVLERILNSDTASVEQYRK